MIKPFGRRIYVKPEEKKQIFDTGDKRLAEFGLVYAVGKEVKSIKEGDKIAFNKWGTDSVMIDEKEHFFILETDDFILGTIEDVAEE